jgi:hypothetical protein
MCSGRLGIDRIPRNPSDLAVILALNLSHRRQESKGGFGFLLMKKQKKTGICRRLGKIIPLKNGHENGVPNPNISNAEKTARRSEK